MEAKNILGKKEVMEVEGMQTHMCSCHENGQASPTNDTS